MSANVPRQINAGRARHMALVNRSAAFKARQRPRLLEMQKAFVSDPVVRAARGWLTEAQRNEVIARITNTKDRYLDIALDYLLSESRVAAIAREALVQRRKRPICAGEKSHAKVKGEFCIRGANSTRGQAMKKTRLLADDGTPKIHDTAGGGRLPVSTAQISLASNARAVSA